MKPLIPRELANKDIDAAIDFYIGQDAHQAASGFVDALENAFTHIGRHPATGSLRYAHALDLPGLRFWPIPPFPYLIFYVELDDRIDVWRVLHGHRDIPAWMQDPEK